MELSGSLFHEAWLIIFGLVYAVAMLFALRWLYWPRLRDRAQQHVYMGGIVILFFLWNLRIEIEPGFFWHLSAMVVFTLMFGWSMALIGGSLALLGIITAGLNEWSGFFPSVIFCVLIPATLTQVMLGLVRAYLPKHFFVYVLVNAFLAGGFIFLIMALSITAGLLLMESYTLAELESRFLIYLPMMVFPESMLNGWIAAILVGFKPHWVGSFNDEEYIKGK